MFEEMMAGVREEVVSMLFHVEVTAQDAELEHPDAGNLIYDGGGDATYDGGDSSTATITPSRSGGSSSSTVSANGSEAIGRNDPCPCGSGRKYKRCHGQAA